MSIDIGIPPYCIACCHDRFGLKLNPCAAHDWTCAGVRPNAENGTICPTPAGVGAGADGAAAAVVGIGAGADGPPLVGPTTGGGGGACGGGAVDNPEGTDPRGIGAAGCGGGATDWPPRVDCPMGPPKALCWPPNRL